MLRAILEKRLLWPALATIAGLALLISLGTWQMQRLAWKQGLIGAINERVHAKPVTMAAIEDRASLGGDVEYARVAVDSQFLNDHEIHLYALDSTHGPGFHVITPLRLADGSVLLVNRGYVPNDLKDPAKRAAGQLTGDVKVVGLLRHPEPQGMFQANNDPGGISGTGATLTRWPTPLAGSRPVSTATSSTPKLIRRPPAAGPKAARRGSSCPTVIWSTR